MSVFRGHFVGMASQEDDAFVESLEQARAGDPDSLHTHVSKLAPGLRKMISDRRKKQTSRTQAFYLTEDCFQSTLARFYAKVSDSSAPLKVTTVADLWKYLMAMGLNKSVDFDRRASAAKRPELHDNLNQQIDEGCFTPSTLAMHEELRIEISKGLSANDKKVLEGRLNGESAEEIASSLESSLSIRSIFRAVRRFKERYRELAQGQE